LAGSLWRQGHSECEAIMHPGTKSSQLGGFPRRTVRPIYDRLDFENTT
jgi:hypothetical protein